LRNSDELGCVNVCSLSNNSATLCHQIAEDQLDVLLVTETWHKCSGDVVLKRAAPVGYRCLEVARPLSDGASVLTDRAHIQGGLALIYRDNVKVKARTL